VNIHNLDRRLPTIPQSDHEIEAGGADVRDIPFYRPASRKESLDKRSVDIPRTIGETHALEALIEPTHSTLYVPKRSR